MRTFRRRILVIALFLMLAYSPCIWFEFATRAYLAAHAATVPLRFDAYADSPYWSPEFAQERDDWNAAVAYDERGFWVHTDFAGKWHNERDGQRLTTGQPKQYAATIYLFGSSTLAGYGVPDDMTIASYLQRLMPAYRVVNLGTSGAIAVHYTARLETLDIRPGDIVVYFGGVMESEAVSLKLNTAYADSAPCFTLRDKYPYLASLRSLCPPGEAGLYDVQNLQGKLADAVRDYRAAVSEARLYVEKAGARFVNILQPHLWSKALSRYEIEVAEQAWPEFDRVLLLIWPMLQTTPDTIDMTHVLDDLRGSGQEVYIDFTHHSEKANQVIARAIADALR